VQVVTHPTPTNGETLHTICSLNNSKATGLTAASRKLLNGVDGRRTRVEVPAAHEVPGALVVGEAPAVAERADAVGAVVATASRIVIVLGHDVRFTAH